MAIPGNPVAVHFMLCFICFVVKGMGACKPKSQPFEHWHFFQLLIGLRRSLLQSLDRPQAIVVKDEDNDDDALLLLMLFLLPTLAFQTITAWHLSMQRTPHFFSILHHIATFWAHPAVKTLIIYYISSLYYHGYHNFNTLVVSCCVTVS